MWLKTRTSDLVVGVPVKKLNAPKPSRPMVQVSKGIRGATITQNGQKMVRSNSERPLSTFTSDITHRIGYNLLETDSRNELTSSFPEIDVPKGQVVLQPRLQGLERRASDSSQTRRAFAPKHETTRSCIACGIVKAPCWRPGWGDGVLCNSCGLRYKKVGVSLFFRYVRWSDIAGTLC